jgi:hypothetical protein
MTNRDSALLSVDLVWRSPEEVVIKEGSVSDELFFITKGTCILIKW